MKQTCIVAAMVLLGWMYAGGGATINVSGGSAAAIQSAVAGSSLGDTIVITDSLIYDFSALLATGDAITLDGRTVRAVTGQSPVLFADPASRTGNALFVLKGSAVNQGVLAGLTFQAGTGGKLVEYVEVPTNYTTLSNNVFALDYVDVGNDGRAVDMAANVQATNSLVEQNLFRYTGNNGGAFRGIYTHAGFRGATFRDNVFDLSKRTSGTLYGISCANESSEAGAGNTAIINNTIVFATAATTYGVANGIDGNGMKNGIIANNIFVNADTVFQDFNASVSTVTLRNNLFENVGTVSVNGAEDTITQIGNLTGAALLSAAYRPPITSPAVNAGFNGLNYGSVDFYGDARVSLGTVDIGAVEFIPEPGTLCLLATGGGLLFRRRASSVTPRT